METPKLPPGLGPYENWPGYKRLKNRLESFFQLRQLGQNGFVKLDFVLSKQSFWEIHRLAIQDMQLVIPSNKKEFENAGHCIRIAFKPANQKSAANINSLIKEDFQKYGVFQITLWAHSGRSNNVSCIYNAMILNESRPEIYLQSLSENAYEIGLDAHGNLFDAFLLSDELRRE